MLTLFSIVIVHELGHLSVARHFGWQIVSLQLLPFGGVVEVDDGGNVPAKEEILVALAGPLQNVWMIVVSFLFFWSGLWSWSWADFFIQSNLLIVLFNLLPIIPLDGGKIMQGILSLRMPFYLALHRNVRFSFVLAAMIACLALCLLGFRVVHVNLLMIGGFLIYANWYEWMHLPYRFMRFLLARYRMERTWSRRNLIVVDRLMPERVVRQFHREREHRILRLSMGKQTQGDFITERQVLEHYFRPFSS